MDDNAKAEADRIWNALKPEMETLAAAITGFYAALGSARQCRHINELWRPESAGVGIGFVPPEALNQLAALVEQSGLHLSKSNGPLGKGVYFSFLHDAQLTPERLHALGEAVAKETQTAVPPVPPASTLPPSPTAEAQVARVEGLTAMRGDKLRTRPHELAGIVDAFNGATFGMSPKQALKLLADAVAYFELPDASRDAIARTAEMMHKAES